MALIALYDACVLYPAALRDLRVRLALTDLFQARWTDEIHNEWTRNILVNRPDISSASLARCRRLMDLHVPDCLITGYEFLIPTLTLPDADDRHVLAAAIHGGAGLIVTFNLNDFPRSIFLPSPELPRGSGDRAGRPARRAGSRLVGRERAPATSKVIGLADCRGRGAVDRQNRFGGQSLTRSWAERSL